MENYHGKETLIDVHFLVTGAAGFIGSHLAEYLLAHGAKVTGLDNLSTGLQSNVDLLLPNPNYRFIQGDILEFETCQKACQDVSYVFHEAALGSVPRSIENPIATNQSNIDGFLNVLTAVKDSKTVKKMVYAASSSTYGDSKALPKVEDQIGKPLSPYAVTKYVNELYADVFAKTYGTKVVGLRYFNVFGPRQNPDGAYAAVIPKFIVKALNQQQITINGDGEHTRDFTYINNVIQCNMKSMFTDLGDQHQVFNTACGGRTSLNDLVGAIQSNVSYPLNVQHGENRVGDIKDSLADISKAQQYIGYSPTQSFEEGIALTFNWFKNQHQQHA